MHGAILADWQWEITVVIALLFLLGARNLRGLGRGLRHGILEFRDAMRQMADELDKLLRS